MPKKGRGEKPQREPTRRQLSHWQQQKRRQRIILITGVVIIVAVLAIVLSGWYTTQYRPLHATAITVNGVKFNMQYYIDMLKVQSRGQSPEFMSAIADVVIRNIEQNELIRQEALTLGITVTDDAVRDKLRSSGLADDRVHSDLIRTQLLLEKVTEAYLAKDIPTTAKQAHLMAMLLESERQAADIRARLEKGEDFTQLAGELSLNQFTKEKKGDLGWHPEDVLNELIGSEVPGTYGFGSEAGVLSQPRQDTEISKKVGYWLIKVLEKQADTQQAKVNAMLLGSEQQAQELRVRLEKGEDFAALAKEFSQLSNARENGGDLGYISRGDMGEVFDKFVYSPDTKAGALSEVIRDEAPTTQGGYWLIKVLEKADDRPIEDSDMTILKNKALNEWVASLWLASNEIDHSYLDNARKVWAILQALKALG